MDALGYKRRALGYFTLDNWGGSSSNDGGSSTSSSGSGEGSTGGGGYSLGGISGGTSQAGGGGYQEEQQPPDNPTPEPAPAPMPVADQYAAYGAGKVAADQLTGTGTATPMQAGQGGAIVTNNPVSFGSQLAIGARALLQVATGLPGLFGLVTMYARGDFDKLEKPSWMNTMDGASDAYWSSVTPPDARTWGGNGSAVAAYNPTAASPAARTTYPAFTTSRPTVSDPYTTAMPGFSLFPGTTAPRQQLTYPQQSTTTNQSTDNGMVLAVLAGLAVLAFS